MPIYDLNLPDVANHPLYGSTIPLDFFETRSDISSPLSSSSFQEEVEDLLQPQPGSMSRAKHWCFTLNNYNAEDIQRIAVLEGEVLYLVYGKEVGESGTPHLQGFVSFHDRLRRSAVVEKLGQAHYTVARKIPESIAYCKKDGDFVEFGIPPQGPGRRNDLEDFKNAVKEGQLDLNILREQYSQTVANYPKFVTDYIIQYTPKPVIELHPLRQWQQTLNADLNREADDRTVVFIVDFNGNSGKSWFCHYYASIHANTQVILPGKLADMAYALNPQVRVLFLDCPRSKQGDFIQYDFLEHVKNRYVFSPKYESRVKQLGKVHVCVMMNETPDRNKLSQDRYDIREV